MMTKKLLSPGVVILLVSLALFLSGRTPSVAAATLTITPSDDAHVRSEYPDRNYGSRDRLRLRSTSSESFNAYLKFNVTDVNGVVQSARLRLYAYNGSDMAGSVYAVSNNYQSQNAPWNEGELTWQNAPTLTGAPLQTLGPVNHNNWVEFDVTATVSGNGTYSFGLTTTSSNSVYYHSKEGGSNGPVLIIEVGDVPTAEPTATATVEPTATAITTATAEPTATASTTVIPTATSTPEPTETPIPTTMPSDTGFYRNMWLSPQEVAGLPTSGAAWNNLLSAAQQDTNAPNIGNQDDKTDVYVLAKALVYARTGETQYRDQVVAAIQAAIGTEKGGKTLALGRNLAAYIIAADLVNLPAVNASVDQQFRTWLGQVLNEELDGMTLRSTHEKRANNWGTHAGASRIAIALYLGDAAELNQAATVFKGWLGDRNAYAGFKYGDLSWQCDAAHPVGINPAGCTIDGHNVDGVLPDDQRRGGSFTWPAPQENYAWGGLQGAVVQAQLLHRAGFPAWEWQDRAILRAVIWLHEQNSFPAKGDDQWQPWLVNYAYGTNFPATIGASPGKGMGWTDWTHAR